MSRTVLVAAGRITRSTARIGGVLFLAAGTVTWVAAWCFVGLLALNQAAMAWMRGGSPSTPPAEPSPSVRTRMNLRIVASTAIALVAGLEYRFGWFPQVPLELQLTAWGTGIGGLLVNLWAMSVNTFFHGVARAGREGHELLTGGPYRYLRHPSSFGVLLSNLSKPLMLGSVWAFLPALFIVGQVLRNTRREDTALRRDLPGYQRYAEGVRYRVLPGVW